MVDKSTLVCGNNSCLGGAGQIIMQGMAGQGCNLIVGFFYLQIKIRKRDNRPGGAAGPIPVQIPQPFPDRDEDDYNKVEVYISFKWPFMQKHKRMQFTMERKWANVIVNRINQINTFNGEFKVTINNLKDDFKVKYSNFKDKFGIKWKK